ncbi:DNA polymerase alpha/epsilon subunit B-domain-containing protein [Piptocephalis cylindrospora]|uniref:DNA polymerase epsilon subunit n=1 Tax=Piptocephalis cylindrospora TaxID=1907219 RepID=A0A4P9Y8U0_9FUNG|nr:DNA polymerase alpha/epsilon subunit B-domain-containing protein [Piptocephalis cylindrospora]|eukprot:RKP15455.1 DNA polymerase alpha/epsilon subunit B-domain-containing protein [Piptocephalis cylindrospora]
MSFQRLAYRTFTKAHGLTLTGQASRYLEYLFLEYELDQQAMAEALTHTAKAIVAQHRQVQVVSEDLVKAVVQTLISEQARVPDEGQENEMDGEERALGAISPFTLFRVVSCTIQDMAGSHYEVSRGRFVPSTEGARSVLGESGEKARLWQDRYHVLLSRLCRTKGYTKHADEVAEMAGGKGPRLISTVSSLRGRTGQKRQLLGMINQREEGLWVLEDPEDFIPVDFAQAQVKGDGYFPEGSIVLVDGHLTEDKTFLCSTIMHPPWESRKETCKAVIEPGFLGSDWFPMEDSILREVEVLRKDMSMVMLSDVHLDDRRVMKGKRDWDPPLCDVSLTRKNGWGILEVFDGLGKMIQDRAPNLAARTHFVFVPGPKDALGDGLLPRPPLLGPMTQGLRSRLGHVHFPTNPCRIRYCGQEMVIHRSNLMRPGEGESQGLYHASRTLYAQSHLSPMTQPLKPVVWCKDHMLRLCPIPDVLVLADQEEVWVDEVGESQRLTGTFWCGTLGNVEPSKGILEELSDLGIVMGR